MSTVVCNYEPKGKPIAIRYNRFQGDVCRRMGTVDMSFFPKGTVPLLEGEEVWVRLGTVKLVPTVVDKPIQVGHSWNEGQKVRTVVAVEQNENGTYAFVKETRPVQTFNGLTTSTSCFMMNVVNIPSLKEEGPPTLQLVKDEE